MMKLEFGPEDSEESLKEQAEMYIKNTVVATPACVLVCLFIHSFILVPKKQSPKSSQMPSHYY